MNFEQLNIDYRLYKKIKEFGFNDLTQIQGKCIPGIRKGMDVVGQA